MKQMYPQTVTQQNPPSWDAPQSLQSIYGRAFRRVEKFVLDKGGQRADAEDLVQEAMMVYVVRALQEPENVTRYAVSYILTVARNIWYKQVRQRKPSIVYYPEGAIPEPWKDTQKLRELAHEEKKQFLSKIIASLDESSRRLLVYYYLEEMSFEDIARAMGYASAQVVKNKKKRTLDLLRNIFLNTNPKQYEALTEYSRLGGEHRPLLPRPDAAPGKGLVRACPER